MSVYINSQSQQIECIFIPPNAPGHTGTGNIRKVFVNDVLVFANNPFSVKLQVIASHPMLIRESPPNWMWGLDVKISHGSKYNEKVKINVNYTNSQPLEYILDCNVGETITDNITAMTDFGPMSIQVSFLQDGQTNYIFGAKDNISDVSNYDSIPYNTVINGSVDY